VRFPEPLRIERDLAACMASSDLAIIATSTAGLRDVALALGRSHPDPALLWACKGFETASRSHPHQVLAQALPGAVRVGALSGPSFALEVARGQATALVAAGADDALLQRIVQALHGDALRVYTSGDIVGVETGGAVKNVLAIATGIVDGLAVAGGPHAPGLNARAALITRGLAEMTRFGLALGARADTFMGLSGLGDLVLTATGAMSRNRQVGLRLASGLALAEVLAELGHVAEGVYSAATALARARALGVDMPICESVVEVLEDRLAPAAAISRLMARQARAEGV
jgi:glycerol-3-phosphate dehydrogenase (NAD(P)+)